MAEVRYRPFRPSDAQRLVAILHEAVHVIGTRDYRPEQLAAWSPAPMTPETYCARIADGRWVTVAVSDGDVPVAFIELEADGHIDCFYCHPDVAGSGVGKALFRQAQAQVIDAGQTRLRVEASEAARRFFLREGFHVTARSEFRRHGVLIHNYEMEKWVGPSVGGDDA